MNDISDAEVELFLSRKEVCNTYCNTVGFNWQDFDITSITKANNVLCEVHVFVLITKRGY